MSDKTGIVDLGRGLVARGFEIVSTGGTARALADAGLPVTSVSALTGFPEMMDGRLKTLHPAVHGGILARRDRPDDLTALETQYIGLVDVVVVNLYPFVKAASDPATPFEALVEEIDIGGPSLVRAAAKNFRGVLVIVDPDDYPRLLSALDEGPSLAFRFELMRKAFGHTAAYDTAIARTLAEVTLVERPVRAPLVRPGVRASQSARGVARESPGPAIRRESSSSGGLVPAIGPAVGRWRGPHVRQGAFVHEPAGPRCRRAPGPRVRRAGRRGRQAHESLRRGDRRLGGRCVRARARRR